MKNKTIDQNAQDKKLLQGEREWKTGKKSDTINVGWHVEVDKASQVIRRTSQSLEPGNKSNSVYVPLEQ